MIFILIFSLYLLTLRGVMGNPQSYDVLRLEKVGSPFENSVERGRYILALSLIHNQTVSLPQDEAYPAQPDIGVYRGQFFTLFTPGVSATIIPFYLLGSIVHLGQVFAYFTVIVVAMLNYFLLYKIQQNMFGFSSKAALFGVALFALATNAWSYGITLYQHHFITCFLLGAVYAIWRYKHSSNLLYVVVGAVCLGLSSFFDEISTIFTLPIMVYFLWVVIATKRHTRAWRAVGIFVLILGTITILHAVYNWTQFGSPFKLTGMIARWREVVHVMTERGVGLEEATRQELSLKTYDVMLRPLSIPKGLVLLFLSPDRGLFFFSPIILYMMFGFGEMKKRKGARWQEYSIFLCVAITIVVVYAAWGDAAGGWAYGPRYLIPAVACIVPFVVRGVQSQLTEGSSFTRRAHFLLIALLLGYSTAVSALGATTTNLIPAQSYGEHVQRGGYNFLLNMKYVGEGVSGSFLYNTWLSWLPLWLFVCVVMIVAIGIQVFLLSQMMPHKRLR